MDDFRENPRIFPPRPQLSDTGQTRRSRRGRSRLHERRRENEKLASQGEKLTLFDAESDAIKVSLPLRNSSAFAFRRQPEKVKYGFDEEKRARVCSLSPEGEGGGRIVAVLPASARESSFVSALPLLSFTLSAPSVGSSESLSAERCSR